MFPDAHYENQSLRERIRRFANEQLSPIAPVADESDEVFIALVPLMAKEGIFRFLIPREYGGYGVNSYGMNSVNLCIIREELSKVCIQADYVFAMYGLGSYPIIKYGTNEQKKEYLPPLANGDKMASFNTTEPDAGSDLSGIKTTAVLRGDDYIINGTKSYATMGTLADPCIVFARTYMKEKTRGISAFIINTKNPPKGLTMRRMNLFAPHAMSEFRFKNFRIPRKNLLGEIGHGMSIALNTLNVLRASVAASALGMGQAAFDLAWKYSSRRIAFDRTLQEFQSIQFKLAEMATLLETCRLLTYQAANLRNENSPAAIKYASMAKYFTTETAFQIVDKALQIHGGIGLLKESHIGRLFRAIRALRIYEGTSEIQLVTIYRQLKKERGAPK